MPSTSPGNNASPTIFAQILPGAPTPGLQSFATFVFRFKRYVAYISGSQLNILSSPTNLVQAIRFNHHLVSVAAGDQTGKLIIAAKKEVWVLAPETEGWTKVWWEKTLLLRREDEGDEAHCLSWGDDGEALVGGSRTMTLFSTRPASKNASPSTAASDDEHIEKRKATWSQDVASPVHQAAFSPSATLIASRGRYDRLVKIWRRLSFEECLFDYTYLPHPGAVTHLQWRPRNSNTDTRRGSGVSGRHDEDMEVLYTIASDGVLRVWRATGSYEVDILVLHATVDLIAAIPQSPSLTIKGHSQPSKAPRYAVVLPSEQFCAAVNAAIGLTHNGKVNHTKELLKEMISDQPDVVVAFDGQGRMSAWGLQSIGHKRRPDDTAPIHPVHIAHAEGMTLKIRANNPTMCGAWFHDNKLHIITHCMNDGGGITWWHGDVESFFSSSTPGIERLKASTILFGHDRDLIEMQSFEHGLMSRSRNEVIQWEMSPEKSLRVRKFFSIENDVLASTTINNGGILLTISAGHFAVSDRTGHCIAQAACEVVRDGKFHVTTANEETVSGVFIQGDATIVLHWTVTLRKRSSKDNLLEVQQIQYTTEERPQYTMLVTMPFNQEQSCLVGVSQAGRISCTLLEDNISEQADFEPFVNFETGIVEPALFSANSEFAALTSKDGRTVVVVDLTDGYIEHRQSLDRYVTHLECFTPRPRHNFLAIGHVTSIEILAQGRYEHHASDVPTWMSIKTISVGDIGPSISAISWLASGSLAVAAGNAIFLATPEVDLRELEDEARDAIDADQRPRQRPVRLPSFTHQVKEPLPVWHPSTISHLLHHGQPEVATTLLKQLARRLKFYSNGDQLHPMLDESPETLLTASRDQESWLDDDAVTDLREQLDEKDLPRTSDLEQQRLKHVIEALIYMREHVNGLDRHALRYLFNWKLQLLFHEDKKDLPNGSTQPNGIAAHERFAPTMDWREICFAYHSTTQQALLDILVLHHDNKLTWDAARKYGVMAWLSDREALESVFEQLGQTAYRSESPPNPVNASMYYLALHKKPTLLALWRIATWHKEQRTTMNFLKRDFAQPDARTAARKNAYALMGKRRFHYGAAFFLLADDPASAVAILAGQCEDVQLAIAVARLYCGDGSPVLKTLLDERIVPEAEKVGNRWLLSWCHSVMRNQRLAAESLIRPLEGLIKTWTQDDPVTMMLYRHLRSGETSEYEYGAVLRAARLLRRMGLWLLALEIVSKWEFKRERNGPRKTSTSGGDMSLLSGKTRSMLDGFTDQNLTKKEPAGAEPPSMLDGFSEPALPAVDEKAAREAKAAELLARMKVKKHAASSATATVLDVDEKPKREPTQFKEPDANSLLDSFGF